MQWEGWLGDSEFSPTRQWTLSLSIGVGDDLRGSPTTPKTRDASGQLALEFFSSARQPSTITNTNILSVKIADISAAEMSHSPSPLFEDHKSKSPPDDDDDDPIVATYSLFTKPPLAENRQLMVLQYVNKTASDPTQIRPLQIQDVRLKPKTGMIEVDVPLDTSVAYDQAKGIKWGSALQKSMETKKGGSLGLAGGFGIGATVNRPGGGRRAAAEDEDLTWQEANRLDKVLRTQTLGGGRSASEQNASFMVGVFQGSEFPPPAPINPTHH